jgi:hypothetical protein
MIYLSSEYIISAIHQIASVHTFIGITFLTCKKHELPVGTPTTFLMDRNTKQFMTSVHKICPTSDFYFQPYQTIRGKQWLAAKYPSSGLQAINTQTFSAAFVHNKNSKLWAWSNDYVEEIKKIAIPKEEKKAPISAMAVWVLKDYKWKDTATLEDVVDKFIQEYHLTKEELDSLFVQEHTFPDVVAFQTEPVSWNQLSNSLSSPPDAAPEQEGTLSKIELTNVGPCDHIEMILSPRLNIITGDNGLGKTFLMDCAWWALTNTWTGNEARPKYAEGSKRSSIGFAIAGKSKLSQEKKVLYDNKNLTWKRSEDTATIPGLIIYALVDGSYAVWDPSKNMARKNSVNVFTRQQVWNGYENNIEGLIRDWVKWQNTPDKYPFEVFKKVLAEMSPPDMGVLAPGDTVRIPNDSREIPTIRYPYGTVPVTNSSAGVGRIITLAYLIVWAWNEHKENCKLRGIKPDSRIVVMVDELEAHLHPKWQRTILPALIEVQKHLASELEIQFIIATHSPLIMASSEPIFNVDTDKLFQIKLAADTSDAIVTEESFIKYGQINAWLTSPIFNLNQARATGAEQAINEAKSLQLAESPSDADVQAVHQKLLQSLAQNDPFWPRWIYFAEQHGVVL